jgi:hypothetical protein
MYPFNETPARNRRQGGTGTEGLSQLGVPIAAGWLGDCLATLNGITETTSFNCVVMIVKGLHDEIDEMGPKTITRRVCELIFIDEHG